MPALHPRYYTNWWQVPGVGKPGTRRPGPGIHYTTGRGYYSNPAGGALTRPGAPVVRPPTKKKPITGAPTSLQSLLGNYFTSFQTPKQMRDAATKTINDQINLGLTQIANAYAQQQSDLKAQQQNAANMAQVLMGMQSDVGKGLQGAYQEAGNRLNAYGTGLTGATAAEMQKENAQTAAQVAAVGGGNVASFDIPGLQSTGQYLGVTLPGRTLEENAAEAYKLGAAQQAGHAWGIEGISSQYGQKLADLAGEIAAKKADLLAQRPTLFTQYLSQLQSGQRQDLATYLSAASLNPKLLEEQSLVNYRKAQTAAARQRAKQAAANAAATEAHARGYWVDKAGKKHVYPGFKLTPSGDVVKTYKPSAPKNAPGASARVPKYTDFTVLQKSLDKLANDRLGISRGSSRPKKTWTLPQLTDFLMRNAGVPFIDQFGEQYRPRVRQMINAASKRIYAIYIQRVKAAAAQAAGSDTGVGSIAGG
jgi:hypothetical protein